MSKLERLALAIEAAERKLDRLNKMFWLRYVRFPKETARLVSKAIKRRTCKNGHD